MSDVSNYLVWLDFETTGIDKDSPLLEVAVVITDNELNRLETYQSIIIDRDPYLYFKFSDNELSEALGLQGRIPCWETHFKSGLIDELKEKWDTGDVLKIQKYKTSFVENEIYNLINEGYMQSTSPALSPLCGSTISFDRGFLERRMPVVNGLLSYRHIDVSSIRELQKRWRPDIPAPEKKEAHRAMDDILESIEYMKHFRKTGFIG